MKTLELARGVLASRYRGRPLYCKVYVTRRCNLRCKMCNVWTFGRRENELAAADYVPVADAIRTLGVKQVVITGGEATLRRDLAEIVAVFAARGFSVRLQTNGGPQLTAARLEELVAAGVEDLNVSLDTLDRAKFDAICGYEGAWDSAVETIRRAVALLPSGSVAVGITMSAENQGEVLDVIDFVEGLGAWAIPMPVMLNQSPDPHSAFRAYSSDLEPLSAESARVRTLFDRLIEAKRRGRRILLSRKYLRDMRAAVLSGDLSWSCDAGSLYFVVREDGEVAPCDDMPPIANATDADFVERFRGAEYAGLAAASREACSGCTHACWREVSNLVHSSAALADWARTVLTSPLSPVARRRARRGAAAKELPLERPAAPSSSAS